MQAGRPFGRPELRPKTKGHHRVARSCPYRIGRPCDSQGSRRSRSSLYRTRRLLEGKSLSRISLSFSLALWRPYFIALSKHPPLRNFPYREQGSIVHEKPPHLNWGECCDRASQRLRFVSPRQHLLRVRRRVRQHLGEHSVQTESVACLPTLDTPPFALEVV